MRPYQVIFFDLDHTLVDTRRQYDLGLAQALDQLYPNTVPDTFVERFHHHHELLWEQYDKREISMLDLRRQRFLRAWQDFGVAKSDEEADLFHQTYDATFESTLFPFPGIRELLAELAKSHKLGIVTNGSPDLQWRKMTIAGIHEFIPEAAVIISERIGMAKPHPSVYAAACQALAVTPEDSLMIGDNYRADYLGAREFGMDAIWYVPDPGMEGERDGETALRTTQQLLRRIREMEQTRLV